MAVIGPIPTTLEMGQDHSVTVYADVRGDLRRAMLDWQAACLNPDITGGSYFEANRRPTKLGPDEGQTPSITVKLLAPDYKTVVGIVLTVNIVACGTVKQELAIFSAKAVVLTEAKHRQVTIDSL